MPADIVGKVIATPGEHRPYRVVIKRGGSLMIQIDADSHDDGENILKEMIEQIGRLERSPQG